MAATVQINFAVGGVGVAASMFRSVTQSLSTSLKEQVRASNQAQKAQLDGVRSMNEAILKAHLDRGKSLMKADIDAARDTRKAKLDIARDEAKERAKIAAQSVRDEARERARQSKTALASEGAVQRAEDRAVRGGQGAFQGVGAAVGRGAWNGAVSGVRTVASLGTRGVQAYAAGMGVDMSVGHAVRQRVEQERIAQDVVNSATNGDKSIAQRRTEAGALTAQAKDVGKSMGFDPTEILAGVQKFVSFTGDLEGAQGSMADLAKIASATGTRFEPLAAAAGALNGKLQAAGGEYADAAVRAKAVNDTMAVLAAQGKAGSIELPDLVKGMGTIGGMAALYGGDRQKTVANLGALAQVSVQSGTAGDAAAGFTSAKAFTATFQKSARRKELAKLGIQTEDEEGNLLAPEEILVNAMRATNGDKDKLLGKGFMDQRSQAAPMAAISAFKGAGGGKKGEQAVRDMFKPFRDAEMTGTQIDQAHGARMETDTVKAEQMQQKIDALIIGMVDKVVPAFLKLAPTVEKAADLFSKLVSTAAEHPWGAVAAIIGGCIAKEIAVAGIGQMIRNMIAGPGGLPGAIAGGGAAAPVAAVLAFGAMAGAGLKGGFDDAEKGDDTGIARSLNMTSMAARLRSGNATDADRAAAQGMVDQGSGPGVMARAVQGATAGWQGLAGGDVSAENVLRATPWGMIAGGATNAAMGGGTNDQQDSALSDLKDALANPKPTQLAPGARVTVEGISELTAAVNAMNANGPKAQTPP